MASKGLILMEWWRASFDADADGTLVYDFGDTIQERTWRKCNQSTLGVSQRPTLWESFPLCVYPTARDIPARRREILIWTDDTLNEYLRR